MFFLLPIGHEQTETRRLPVVSLVILALNAFIFLFTFLRQGDSVDRAAMEAGRDAVAFCLQHPYLELDKKFAERFALKGGKFEREIEVRKQSHRVKQVGNALSIDEPPDIDDPKSRLIPTLKSWTDRNKPLVSHTLGGEAKVPQEVLLSD